MKSNSSSVKSTSSDYSSKIRTQSISTPTVVCGLTCLPNKDEDRYCIYSPPSSFPSAATTTTPDTESNPSNIDDSYFGFGVFDGHGGMFGSELCSRLLCKEVIEDVLSKQNKLNKLNGIISNQLTEQDEDYNDIVDAFYCESIKNVTKSLSREIKQISKTGTTSCTLFLKKLSNGSYRAYCGNTGDSRCVVYCKRGIDDNNNYSRNENSNVSTTTKGFNFPSIILSPTKEKKKESSTAVLTLISSAWTVVAMSDDHNLDSEEEIRRIEKDLPTPWYPLPANIGSINTTANGKQQSDNIDDFDNDDDYETSFWQYPSVEKMARIQLLRNNLDAYFQAQQDEEEAAAAQKQQELMASANAMGDGANGGTNVDDKSDSLTLGHLQTNNNNIKGSSSSSKVSSDSAISISNISSVTTTAIISLDSFKSLDLSTKLALLTSFSQSNLATLDSLATVSAAIAAIGGDMSDSTASQVTREVSVVDETFRRNSEFIPTSSSSLTHTKITTSCNYEDGDENLTTPYTSSLSTKQRTNKNSSFIQRVVSMISQYFFSHRGNSGSNIDSKTQSTAGAGLGLDGSSLVEFDDTVHGHDQLEAAAARKQTLTLAYETPSSAITPRSLAAEQLLMDLSLHSVASRGSVLSVYEPEYDTPTDDNEFITAPLFHRKSFIACRQGRDGTFSNKCALFSRHNISITMTRSIGDRHAARSCVCTPDVSAIMIQPHEYSRFIIGSDGFWDVYSNQQAMEMVWELTDVNEASAVLVRAARRMREALRIRIDDITCLVVDINPTHHPVRVFEAAAAAAAATAAQMNQNTNSSRRSMSSSSMTSITSVWNEMFMNRRKRGYQINNNNNNNNKSSSSIITTNNQNKNKKYTNNNAAAAADGDDDYDLDSRRCN